jgi:hypothetical protein
MPEITDSGGTLNICQVEYQSCGMWIIRIARIAPLKWLGRTNGELNTDRSADFI